MRLTKEHLDNDEALDIAIESALEGGQWDGRLHFALIAAVLAITLLVLSYIPVSDGHVVAITIAISFLCLILVLNMIATLLHANLLMISAQLAAQARARKSGGG